jgi:hypothetical protein
MLKKKRHRRNDPGLGEKNEEKSVVLRDKGKTVFQVAMENNCVRCS